MIYVLFDITIYRYINILLIIYLYICIYVYHKINVTRYIYINGIM